MANIAIRASFFCLSIFWLFLPVKKKNRLELLNIVLQKGNRNREEGFSPIYAIRKLSSAALNKGEGC